jgi:hypothetical protein
MCVSMQIQFSITDNQLATNGHRTKLDTAKKRKRQDVPIQTEVLDTITPKLLNINPKLRLAAGKIQEKKRNSNFKLPSQIYSC